MKYKKWTTILIDLHWVYINQFEFKKNLGKISKSQVKLGFEALGKIEKCLLENKFEAEFENAVNDYYTRIPHAFGYFFVQILHRYLSRDRVLLKAFNFLKDIYFFKKIFNISS